MSTPPVVTTKVLVEDAHVAVPVADAAEPLNTTAGLPLSINQPSIGSSTAILLPRSMLPADVKDTVTFDVTPGVSTDASHDSAPLKTPAVTASTVKFVGPETTFELVSRVTTDAYDLTHVDDGVVTTGSTNSTCAPSAMSATCVAILKTVVSPRTLRAPANSTPDIPVDGFMKLTTFVLLLLSTTQPRCAPAHGGNVIVTVDPTNSDAVVVNDTVAVDVTPGVSVLESHRRAPFSTPAVISSTAIVVGPSDTYPVGPLVVSVAPDAARTDGGLVTAATVNDTDVFLPMSAPAVVITSVRVADVHVLLPVIDALALPPALLPCCDDRRSEL